MIFVVSADEHANWKVVEVVANDNLSVEKRINWSLTQEWRNKVVARNKARSATRCTSGSAGTRTSRSARRWPRSSARTIRSSSVGTRGLQSQGQYQWRTAVLRVRRSVGITKDMSVPPNRQLTMRPLRKYWKKKNKTDASYLEVFILGHQSVVVVVVVMSLWSSSRNQSHIFNENMCQKSVKVEVSNPCLCYGLCRGPGCISRKNVFLTSKRLPF